MSFDKPELERKSPLDMIASATGSRSSVASLSSDHGILDAFPLPSGIVDPTSHDASRHAHESSTEPRSTLPTHLVFPPARSNGEEFKSLAGDPPAHKTQERYSRYGHTYGNSLRAGAPAHHTQAYSLSNASPSPRPPLVRQHSASRSWDAGERFSFPPPQNVIPYQTWQEHICAGSIALAENDPVSSRQHWTLAASRPWNNELARLLLQLALSEGWFTGSSSPVPDITVIDINGIRNLTMPITGRLIEALVNYAAKIKGAQYDVEALKCYEAAVELGSRDAAISAAQIYFKGSRRIKRDVSKAQRLYERANGL